jgi:hypothetical protein
VDIRVLKYVDEERVPVLFPGLAALPEDETAVWLGPTYDFGLPTAEEVWRSECHGLRVYDDAVYVVALDKYTRTEVESCDVSDVLGVRLK